VFKVIQTTAKLTADSTALYKGLCITKVNSQSLEKLVTSNLRLSILLLGSLLLICKTLLINESSFASVTQKTINDSSINMQKGNNDNNSITSATVIAAIIAAGASVVAACIAGIFGARNQTKLNNLEKIRAQEDALLDYQYEVRKRLYKEFEPLLFQLYELSGRAYKRVLNLSIDYRQGNLEPDKGWLSDITNYYTTLTIYIFLAPLAIFKLMQRKLTLFDLKLDPVFNNHYFIAKALYRSFLHDFKLAYIDPTLDYHPIENNSGSNIVNNHPEREQKQGLYSGILDTVTDVMIVKEQHGSESVLRIMNYGEFVNNFFKNGDIQEPFNKISYLFYNFTPKTHPILWRILIAQAFIYQLIIETYRSKDQPDLGKPNRVSKADISEKISSMASENNKETNIYFD
jgi:hypothetical protein